MPLHIRSLVSSLSNINPAAFFPYSLSPPFPLSLSFLLSHSLSLPSPSLSLLTAERSGQIGPTDVMFSEILAFFFSPPYVFPTRFPPPTTLGDEQNLTETLFGECAFSFEFRHSDANAHVLNTNRSRYYGRSNQRDQHVHRVHT